MRHLIYPVPDIICSNFLDFWSFEVDPRPLGAAFRQKHPKPVAPRGHDATRTSPNHTIRGYYPAFPFLGVHFTRMIRGGIEAGPYAILATAREGYRKRDVNLADLTDALTFPGLWRFMRQHGKMCREEVYRAFSKRLFCASLRRLVPDLREEDLAPGGAGVRAQAMTPAGRLVEDFEIIARRDALHVLNAPSPGATASLVIGDEIAFRVPRAPDC